MYKTTLNDDNLKDGLAVSATLHVMLFLFLYFGLPRLWTPLPSHHEPVPFEIVTIADITNTRIKEEQEPPKPPAPPPQALPKPVPAPPPPPVVKEEPKVEALKPKPIEKPKPVEKPAPPQDMLSSVLKDVAKMKPVAPVKDADPKADTKTPAQPVSNAPALSSRLTITEEDLLRRQIEQCWNPPIGARDAQNLIVELIINVNTDRNVIDTDIVDKMRYGTDSFFRAAADAAVRAVRNPKCNPLSLPEGKYDQWKRIDFTFDPRDML